MELVYLWVEDYKNIKEQGFNFSPRFDCHYDGEELMIKENPEHISNFFGENINVTAIVGKNGSGKSRILELFTKNDYTSLFFDEQKNGINIHDSFDIFLINDNENSYLYQNNLNVNQIISKKSILKNDDNLKYQINNLTISFLSEIGSISPDIYFSPTGVNLTFNREVTIDNIKNLQGAMIVYSNTYHDTTDRETIHFEDLKIIKTLFENKLDTAIHNKNFKSYLKLREFIFRISRRDNIIFKHLNFQTEYDDKDNITSVFEYIYKNFLIEHIDKNFDKIITILENINIESYNRDKIIINYDNNDFSQIEILLINLHRGYFDIDFFLKKENKIIYFHHLSDGEQQILLIFSKIYYPLRTISKSNDKNIILLIDEPDTFLHPNWQKSFLSYFHQFINNLKFLKQKKIQLIFTTHSPFLLSDILKQNIIFLEKEENGNCKVLTHDEVLDKKQTFGANIHTLLSDSFFMEDGLMGEFAKNKINKIMRFLNGDSKFIDFPIEQIIQTIESIGEDLLRMKLLDMYYEKFEDDELEREKKQLIKQQEEIEKRIQSIEDKQK